MRYFWLFFSFLLTFSLHSGIKPVNAQEITDTPTPIPTNTPTYVPIFNPVTKTPVNVECPGHQPIGWGEVTPAPMWSMYCMQCVTPESNGWDWGENPFDATPTSDLTPGNTPTPTPQFKEMEVLFNWPYSSYPDELIPANTMHSTNMFEVSYGDIYNLTYYMRESSVEEPYINSRIYGQYYGVYYLPGRGPSMSGYNSGVKVTGECRAIDGCLLNFEDVEYPLNYGQKFTFYEGIVNLGAGANLVTGEINFYVDIYKDSVETNKQGFTVRVEKLSNYIFYDSSWFNDFIWDYDPISFEPPPPDTFCSTVLGNDTDPVLGEEGSFKIPVPSIGQGVCFSTISFNIPLDWLSSVWPEAQDISLPGVNFCFLPISFGNLSMFGISIDMDILALAMAAIVLLRFITRS